METNKANEINKLIPKIRYSNCAGLREAVYINSLGKRTAALLLPSSFIYERSPSYTTVHTVTGDLMGEHAPSIVRMSTLLEMVSAAWRYNANINVAEISRMHKKENIFPAALDAWIASKNTIDCIRIFLGGNPCCGSILLSCINAAQNHTDKTIFIPLEGQAANAASKILRKIKGNNLLVFEEEFPGRMARTVLPKLRYSPDGNIDDVSFFPDSQCDATVSITKFDGNYFPWWFCLNRKLHANKKEQCPRAGNYRCY